MKLKITRKALGKIHQAAQAASALECFGLLAGRAGSGVPFRGGVGRGELPFVPA